jgi:hypothetical protein
MTPERQGALDRQYVEAFKELPPGLRAQMESLGIKGPCLDREAPEGGRLVIARAGDASELYEGRLAERVDFAASVDKLADELAERFQVAAPTAARLAAFMEQRIREAGEQRISLALARIVGFFLTGSENLQARAHGLAHACRMASINGFPSLRRSAEVCNVSVEWLRRVAWKWCALLNLTPKKPNTTARKNANRPRIVRS